MWQNQVTWFKSHAYFITHSYCKFVMIVLLCGAIYCLMFVFYKYCSMNIFMYSPFTCSCCVTTKELSQWKMCKISISRVVSTQFSKKQIKCHYVLSKIIIVGEYLTRDSFFSLHKLHPCQRIYRIYVAIKQ